jgi:small-conductance mechanosensitive channel
MDIASPEMNYIYGAIAVIAGILIAFLARFVVRWLKVKAEETETKWDDIIIAAIGTPLQVTIVAVAIYIALTFLGIMPLNYPGLLDDQIIQAFWIVMGAWIISSFLHDIILVYGHDIAEKSESDWDDRLVELLELIVKYVVWFAALMLVLATFRVDITPFLAGAGIAGLALALAAQDIISNFFGGAIITVDKPFTVGDRVKVDDFYGDIISIGPRSTRLRTLDNQIVTIPNNKITTNVITNFSQPDVTLRMTIPVTVAYGTDVEKVKTILLEISRDAIEHTDYLVSDPAPKVFFTEFGDSGLKFILYVWARRYNLPDEVRDTVNSAIARRFSEENIEIPFPQLEVRMKKA